jgi:hypothetical protein
MRTASEDLAGSQHRHARMFDAGPTKKLRAGHDALTAPRLLQHHAGIERGQRVAVSDGETATQRLAPNIACSRFWPSGVSA